jgi:hypothetical protein
VLCLLFGVFRAWQEQHQIASQAISDLDALKSKGYLEAYKARAEQLDVMEFAIAYENLENRVRQVSQFDPWKVEEPIDYNENEMSQAFVESVAKAIARNFGPIEETYFRSRADFVPTKVTGDMAISSKYKTWQLHYDFLRYCLGRLGKIVERNPKRPADYK